MKTKLRAVSAAAVGRSHVRRGEPCADAVATRCFGRFAAVAVLADGAGSARFGVQAAQMAVKETIAQLEAINESASEFSISALKEAISVVAADLAEAAVRDSVSISDYGTTLLVACVKMKRGKLHYCLAHVGDGCIVAATTSNGLVLSEPRRGEHANETYFLTPKNVEMKATFECGSLDARYGLILMSDGTASCLYDYRNRSPASGCGVILNWAGRLKKSRLQRVISHNVKEVFTEYTSDDCSIAILKPLGVEISSRYRPPKGADE